MRMWRRTSTCEREAADAAQMRDEARAAADVVPLSLRARFAIIFRRRISAGIRPSRYTTDSRPMGSRRASRLWAGYTARRRCSRWRARIRRRRGGTCDIRALVRRQHGDTEKNDFGISVAHLRQLLDLQCCRYEALLDIRR